MYRRIFLCTVVAALTMQPPVVDAAETHTVRIVSDYANLKFYFEPKSIIIQPGDTVVWINEAAEEHNVMTYPGGYPKNAKGFRSPLLEDAEETFSHTFRVLGTYQYHCLPHLLMGMNGQIVVGRHSTAEEFHEPTNAELKAYRDELLTWFDEDDNLFQVRAHEKRNNSR